MSAKGSSESLDVVYAERNAAALAFASAAVGLGWRVGHGGDDPEWPILFVDTPVGQVSWHLRAQELPAWIERYGGEWDGHDDAEKARRLAELAADGDPIAFGVLQSVMATHIRFAQFSAWLDSDPPAPHLVHAPPEVLRRAAR